MIEKLVHKTIYDIKHKTTKQVGDILLHEEAMFYQDNPGFKYHDYKFIDGMKGERVVTLIFRRNAD